MMYNSAFYKHGARARLQGCYAVAAICAIIFMLPQYLISSAITAMDTAYPGSILLTEIFMILCQIFVINIFEIGFIRFLMQMIPSDQNGRKSYDYNLVLSGYTKNFGVSLRATFMVMLKLFLFVLLALIPTAAIITYILMYVPWDAIVHICSEAYEIAMSPSPQAIGELSLMIEREFPHLSLFSVLYTATTIGACVPLIYKLFEYKMVPFILADDTTITYKSAMKRTSDIMEGFRWRFFLIELSFIGFYALMYLIFVSTGSILIYSAAYALLLPYRYMTYIEFYLQRSRVVNQEDCYAEK